MGKLSTYLKETELFYNLTPAQLEQVEKICEDVSYSAGEIIFSENSRDKDVYFILDGLVEILVNPALVTSAAANSKETSIIATLMPGQVLGEVALVDEGVRSATARSASDHTVVTRIPRVKFMLLCNMYPELGYRVMYNLAAALAQKMRSTDMKIREMMLYQQVKRPPGIAVFLRSECRTERDHLVLQGILCKPD